MKNTLKLISMSAIIFAGLVAVWANGTIPNASVAAEAGTAASAPKLFVSNCARCHGADGHGETALGKSLDTPNLVGNGMSAAKIKSIITKGSGSMPAFGRKLKAA